MSCDIYNVECITPKKEFLSSTQALVIQIDNSSIIIHWKKIARVHHSKCIKDMTWYTMINEVENCKWKAFRFAKQKNLMMYGRGEIVDKQKMHNLNLMREKYESR